MIKMKSQGLKGIDRRNTELSIVTKPIAIPGHTKLTEARHLKGLMWQRSIAVTSTLRPGIQE